MRYVLEVDVALSTGTSPDWKKTDVAESTAQLVKVAKAKGDGKYRILRVVQEFSLTSERHTTFEVTRHDEHARRKKPAPEPVSPA